LIRYYVSDNLFLFLLLLADSLSYTSAISVALAIVFVIITAGIAIVKLIAGQIPMPKLFPAVSDLASVWELFTAVPVLVTAYVCHYNGTNQFGSDLTKIII
jgi:hypothetical protein